MGAAIVDGEKCVGCGACVDDCFTRTIYLEGGKARLHEAGCVECGHCYAICPTGAVTLPGYDYDDLGPVTSFAQFDEDAMLQSLKSRRTIRRFTDEPVTEEQIAKIIEAGRYSATALNTQNVSYTVLRGNKLAEFEAIGVAMFRKWRRRVARFNPLAKHAIINDDFFFRGAPVAIIVSMDKWPMERYGTDVNGGLAAAHMETQAQAMGLSVLYSGFSITVARLNGKAKRLLGLRRKARPVTCLVIGHTDISYRRVPPRKPAQVTYLGKH